jgi:conjugal transfer/type IV secretion protein DotA/TraY
MSSPTARKVFFTVFALLIFASGQAFASITDVSPTDKSVEYLRYIFGSVVDIIIGGTGPASPDSIIGALSEILNTGMLVFTGLIVGYVFLTGVLNSAHEGNPLGKAYSTMWIPLRMVFALALVLPFAGGYSAMQIGVIWIAGHGIGLANTSWEKALDYMSSTGTLYPPTISVKYEEIGRNILESRVCMHGINTADRHVNVEEKPVEHVNNNQNTTMANSGDTISTPSKPHHRVEQRYDSSYNIASAGLAYAAAFLSGFTNGVPRSYGSNPCGSITLEFAEIDEGVAIEGPVLSFQQKIIEITANLDESLDPLARSIVAKAVDDSLPDPDVTAFNSAIQTYETEYLKAVKDAMSGIATIRINKWASGNPDTASTTIGARDAGWITVGAWYWDFQRINAETQAMVNVKPELSAPTEDARENSDYPMFDSALKTYFSKMLVKDRYGNTVNALERSSYLEDDWTLPWILDRTQFAIDHALTNPDPVSGMANVGHTIIVSVEAVYLASLKLYIPAKTGKDVAETVGGFSGGAAMLPLSVITTLLEEARTLLVIGGILLLPIAIMLAFYLPATPMILWIMGVAGWFILLIEAVIAAPIWAASHAMPEGNGFVGQRAMAGYMVMLSLFLRPTLMIFGFFASMVLMIVMGKVVMLLFLPAMSSMNAGYLSGIVTLFAMLAIFTAVVIQIAHRAYGLIHEVPDKVLRYIGGGAENLGEASNEQQSRGIFVGGAAKAVDGTTRHKQLMNKGSTPGNDSSGEGQQSSMGGAAASGTGKAMSKISKMLSPK